MTPYEWEEKYGQWLDPTPGVHRVRADRHGELVSRLVSRTPTAIAITILETVLQLMEFPSPIEWRMDPFEIQQLEARFLTEAEAAALRVRDDGDPRNLVAPWWHRWVGRA